MLETPWSATDAEPKNLRNATVDNFSTKGVLAMKTSAIFLIITSIFSVASVKSSYGEVGCYKLGYRYGLCVTRSMHGIPCKPENDIIIPTKYRGKTQTKKGINAGVKVVYDTLNLDKGSSRSQEDVDRKKKLDAIREELKAYTAQKKPHPTSSLDMLTTPIDVLRNRLKGKTTNEVKTLVGSPERIEVFVGKNCWIYGNTHTSKDRGIVFDGGRVLTVTFY